MRIAGDRGVDEIGAAFAAVLDGERRAGGVVRERHPADLARVDAFEAALALSGGAEVLGGVSEYGVVRLMDGVPDQKPFRLRGREFCCKRDGLVVWSRRSACLTSTTTSRSWRP